MANHHFAGKVLLLLTVNLFLILHVESAPKSGSSKSAASSSRANANPTKEEQQVKMVNELYAASKRFYPVVSDFLSFQKKILPLLEKAQSDYAASRAAEKKQKQNLLNTLGNSFVENVQSALKQISDGIEKDKMPDQFLQYEPKHVVPEEEVAAVNKFLASEKSRQPNNSHFGQSMKEADGALKKLNANPELFDDENLNHDRAALVAQIEELQRNVETLDEIAQRRKNFRNSVKRAADYMKAANNVRNLNNSEQGAALQQLQKRRALNALKYEIGKYNLVLIKVMGLLLNRFTGQNFDLVRNMVKNRQEVRVQREAVEVLIVRIEGMNKQYEKKSASDSNNKNVISFLANIFQQNLDSLEEDVMKRAIKVSKEFDLLTKKLLPLPTEADKSAAKEMLKGYFEEVTDKTFKM